MVGHRVRLRVEDRLSNEKNLRFVNSIYILIFHLTYCLSRYKFILKWGIFGSNAGSMYRKVSLEWWVWVWILIPVVHTEDWFWTEKATKNQPLVKLTSCGLEERILLALVRVCSWSCIDTKSWITAHAVRARDKSAQSHWTTSTLLCYSNVPISAINVCISKRNKLFIM